MITFQNIHKQFGAKVLYNNLSFSLNPIHCIGFIGPNGSGKTILLRILAGKETVDSGVVTIPSDLRIGYLPQEMNITRSVTPLNLVLEPFSHLLNTESVIEQLASGANDKKTLAAYDALHTEREIHEADSLHARAEAILAGLGVPEHTWEESILKLSGGFHMRVLLAQLLLCKPDFLLLDEPTNHLDMDSLIWVEKFLQRCKGGMLIVSHDRDFLNRITDHTIEISGGMITQYSGNVGDYCAWKETHRASEARRVKNLQDKITKAEQFVTRFKAKNTKASQARSKMKQVEKLKEQLPEEALVEKEIHFQLPAPSRCGAVPLQCDTVGVSYDSVKVFDAFSLTVTRGDKIAVIGPNGAGKSTLLKICSGEISPDSGRVIIGHNTQISYYSQHRLEQLNPEKTVFETVADSSIQNDKTAVQSILGAFLFSGDDALKKVKILSGGEKSRLSLATLLANPGNVLLLDEPTNHLDVASVERLAEALSRFTGTMLIVSHDEYFLSRITNRIIELRPGMYRNFPGTLSDYRLYIENGYIDPLTLQPQKDDDKNKDKLMRIKKRQERKKIERQIVKTEKVIENCEKTMADLTAELDNPANASKYTLLTQIHGNLEESQKEYDRLMEEWEALHRQLEQTGD